MTKATETTVKLEKLSTEDLKAEIKRRNADKVVEAKEKKEKYEKERDTLVASLMTGADRLAEDMSKFKELAFSQLREFYNTMLEYGSLRGGANNKGSFSVLNSDQTIKVVFSSQVVKDFDERSAVAEKHLRDFAEAFVRKKDERNYKLLMACLERNSRTGKLDIGQVSKLYKLEDDFKDFPQFGEAVKLFKESYVEKETAHYVRFFKKNSIGKYESVQLDFASI